MPCLARGTAQSRNSTFSARPKSCMRRAALSTIRFITISSYVFVLLITYILEQLARQLPTFSVDNFGDNLSPSAPKP